MDHQLLPVRNFRCTEKFQRTHQILDDCSRTLKEFHLTKILGEGTNGIVYKGYAKYQGKKVPIAVKFSKNMYEGEMVEEIEFTYYMSEVGIGPILYDSFFYKDNDGKLVQVMVMEPADMDCSDALVDPSLSVRTKKSICKKMISLIYRQMFEFGLICTDVKPLNFVYMKAKDEVKMIDFGEEWCEEIRKFKNYHPRKIELEAVYSALIIQMFILTKELLEDYKVNPNTMETILSGYRTAPYFPKTAEQTKVITRAIRRFPNLRRAFVWYMHGIQDPDEHPYLEHQTQELINQLRVPRKRPRSPKSLSPRKLRSRKK